MSIIRTILPAFGFVNKLVNENTRVDRLKTCVSCPSKKYFEMTRSCLICGCFVREKVELKNEECPDGYWDKEN